MAPKSSLASLIGAAVIVVWGIELIHSAVALLMPIDQSIPEITDYLSGLKIWSLLRLVLSSVGVIAGVLVFRGRKLGHWLNAAAALGLLLSTDFGWFKMLWPGVIHSKPFTFFFVNAPSLGYGVIVVPIIAIIFLVLSLSILVRGRRHGKSAI
jgi:hypothetical protein